MKMYTKAYEGEGRGSPESVRTHVKIFLKRIKGINSRYIQSRVSVRLNLISDYFALDIPENVRVLPYSFQIFQIFSVF